MPNHSIVRTIAAATHGRYLLRPPLASPAGLIVAFHGYAQDCATMLDDLAAIRGTDRWTVVSVQGLHRFYNRAEQVVASWMTREDRELAIADNLAYVRAIIHEVRESEPAKDGPADAPLVFAGFSQGAAMAFRAAAAIECAGVIALGGDIPPDVRAVEAPLPRVLLGRGTRDTWYTHEKFEADAGWLRATGTDADAFEFDGGHEWSDAFRERAAAFLERTGPAPGIPIRGGVELS